MKNVTALVRNYYKSVFMQEQHVKSLSDHTSKMYTVGTANQLCNSIYRARIFHSLRVVRRVQKFKGKQQFVE